MNPDTQIPPQGQPNQDNNQLFSPRYTDSQGPQQPITLHQGMQQPMSPQPTNPVPQQGQAIPMPQQPSSPSSPQPSGANYRTGSSFPWAPTPETQPHPAQPASPASNERMHVAPPPATPQTRPGSLPQYGGQMAELPPLAQPTSPQQAQPHAKSNRSLMKLLFGGLIALAFVALMGAAILVVLQSRQKKPATTQKAIAAITYNAEEVKKQAAAKQLNVAALQKMDKTSTFYSAFRTAAQAPVVQTSWDVYYTKNQKDSRGEQYNLYSVGMDYRSKKYTYDEDDFSNIGVIQSRCIDAKQYIFNASKLSTAKASWQAASDSTSCSLSSVATRVNDGMNTGGLDSKQSDAFVQQLNKSGALSVNSANLVTQKGASYIKFDITVTPQKKTAGVYWGMQNFMQAFQATGLNAGKYPYTYFGASGEGAHVQYYVDPATMLPVYSTAISAPAYDANGKPVSPSSWSHRFVEYRFPTALDKPGLENHDMLAFSAWPDH